MLFLAAATLFLLLVALYTVNPQPAKQAAAKAYCLFNMVKFTVGAETGGNTINVAMQLQDARGQNIAQIAECPFYLSANSDGSTLSGTAATSALAVGANGVVLSIDVTGLKATCISNKSGQLDVNIIQSATPVAYYLVVILPDGSIAVSPIIQF